MAIKIWIVNPLLIFSILCYGLDSYSIFNIPFSWIGLIAIFAVAVFSDYKILFNWNLYLLICLFLIPTLFSLIPLGSTQINLNLLLRILNIVSFFMVFHFSLDYFNASNIADFINLLQKLILIFSLYTVYVYFAQIYDLSEFIRNRSNTGLLGNSSQTIFWKYEPHRAMGSFREPILLSSVLMPLYLLYLFTAEKLHKFTVIFTSLAIGLTRSDLVKVYCLILLVVLTIAYLKTQKMHNSIFPIMLILVFSFIGIRECDLNPQSMDCLNSTISSSEIEIFVFNGINEVLEIDNERNDVIDYFISSIKSLTPQGVTNVNSGFSTYLSREITNEMYLTNRSLPNFLLTRYESKNFGTGNYSLLKYFPNVQNLFVNTTLSLGPSFVAFLFFIITNLWISNNKDLHLYLYMLILFFFFLIPTEELNAFSALVIGVGYNMIVRDEGIKQ